MQRILYLTLLLCFNSAPASPGAQLRPVPAIPFTPGLYACTVSAKVYLLTEAGLIGVGFSVTADSCAEAYQGIRGAVSGFLKAL